MVAFVQTKRECNDAFLNNNEWYIEYFKHSLVPDESFFRPCMENLSGWKRQNQQCAMLTGRKIVTVQSYLRLMNWGCSRGRKTSFSWWEKWISIRTRLYRGFWLEMRGYNKKVMKVLVISQTVFSKTSNMGKTLTSYLRVFDLMNLRSCIFIRKNPQILMYVRTTIVSQMSMP